MEIDGNRYRLFVLDADKGHILEIIRTLKFISFKTPVTLNQLSGSPIATAKWSTARREH